MKHSIKRKVIATVLASVMVLPVALSACKPKDKGSGDEWTITLNYNDGVSRNNYIYVDKETGELTNQMPGDPVREGYSFDGWYTEDKGGDKVDITTLKTADTTVYAHWVTASYTVSFDYNYDGGGTYKTATVEYGKKVTAPETDPTREKYKFDYWATTADGSAKVDFDTYTVKRDVTFYASWYDENIQEYTVVLDYNNGSGGKAEYKVKQGEKISKANAKKATRKGYTLLGYADKADASPSDPSFIDIEKGFGYAPTSSCTLYAVWELTEYTATFRYNYFDNPKDGGNSGAVYHSTTYHYQDTVNAPETDPEREGYTFEGWYTLATNNGVKVEFPYTAEDSGASYYAHWKSLDVTTDIFDAEYTEFDPVMVWIGYSGGAQGNGCVTGADVSGVRVDNYPKNSKRPDPNKGFYVTFQYVKGKGLIFTFYAKEDITNASLIVNWAVELAPGGYMTFGPTGDNAYEVALDGEPLNYTPVEVGGPDESLPGGQFKSGFHEYTLMTGLTLTKGVHTITMIPRNDNPAFGGSLTSVAPMTDYIRIAYDGTGKLYWNPVYDNLDDKT